MSVSVTTFELENAGAGMSPFRLKDTLSNPDIDAVVLLLQRDYHCRKCRQQVQDVAARYDEFEGENALVVSVLPEPVDQARGWQESYDLPFPLLADPAKQLGDDLDQPSRFGVLGNLHDMIGRMPEALVVDVREDDPTVTYVHKGTSPADRPSIDELLAEARQLS
ncbi:redoxin domain-containing protein [Halapricum hydrolyticum]|uniref:Peroxiredoxin family protein n=1 Tax=Halapricum hydrolyticum TaxID=2979991 RepID=A0AAE3LFF6_9EURY|nr:redoxin domain-containing protein [Halapricum hydrolyticum]MCU4718127.1 peroxiredoxin family protein [Halapricum hydrolyticum]MCU4727365.1 peroxiredoxin family protein [Halapricum hydrolyticum]